MDWLTIARELLSISQIGGHYASDPFDRQRYERLGQIAAEIMAGGSGLDPETILRWQTAEFGYATPKVDTRAVILRGDRIMLIREDMDQGRWALPGGWADVNETPAQAVMREVAEETGFQCRVVGLLALLDREKQGHLPPFPYHAWKVFFHCEITGGAPKANLESSELDFFDPDNLPELSQSRVLDQQIRRLVDKIRTGDRVADYD